MLTEGIGPTIIPIALMFLVIVAAYYTTRAISTKAQKINKGKCLKVIDRLVIGRDKHILLLEAGDTVYLLGITGQNMTPIGTLPKERMEQFLSAEKTQSASGESVFQSVLKRLGGFSQMSNKRIHSNDEWKKWRNKAAKAKEGKERAQSDKIDDMMQAIDIRRTRIRRSANDKGGGK